MVWFNITFSPLKRTELGFIYVDHVLQFTVLHVCQRLYRDVCLLLLWIKIVEYNLFMFNALPYEVETNINMLALIMKHNSFHQGNYRLVIVTQSDRHLMTSHKLIHEIPKKNGLLCRHCGCHELGFAYGQCNNLLLLR